MEKTPVLRLSGKRVKAKKLKVGAYRQIMLLLEDVEALDPEELKEDMVAAIRIALAWSLPMFWHNIFKVIKLSIAISG